MGNDCRFGHRLYGRKFHPQTRLDFLGRGAVIAAALALASPVLAQDMPPTYAVTGVAADDTLNIRAEPSANAEILGTYPPDRRRIEVIARSDDGAWGLVGLPEGNGWVNLRYLKPEEAAPSGSLSLPLSCFGTEPFWSLRITPNSASISDPDAGHTALELADGRAVAGGIYAELFDPIGVGITMIAQPLSCSDGMSDRNYGWRTLLYQASATLGGQRVLSGCCTLDGG